MLPRYHLPCTPLPIPAAQLWKNLDKATLYLAKWGQQRLGTQQGLGEPLWLLCVPVRGYVGLAPVLRIEGQGQALWLGAPHNSVK